MLQEGIKAVVQTTPNGEIVDNLSSNFNRCVAKMKKDLSMGNMADAAYGLSQIELLTKVLSALAEKMQ